MNDQLVRPSAISRLVRPGAEHRHDRQREDQRRDRQHQVGQAVDEIVPPAAEIAGRQAQRHADDAVDELRDDADRERDARAVHDAGVDVAALRVGAEPPIPARRLLRIQQVGVHHRIGVRQPRREQADEHRRREQHAADDEIGAELHRRPQVYLIRGSITRRADRPAC